MTRRLLLAFLILLASSSGAQAICVLCTCTTTTSNVAFGNYSPMSFGSTDTTGNIKVNCGGVASVLLPFNIAFSAGSSGSFATRRLRSGSNTLNYNLYLDASYGTVWGDGTGGSQSVDGFVTLDALGLSPAQTFWIYGRIPARQLTAIPGVYADTINVTLTYY